MESTLENTWHLPSSYLVILGLLAAVICYFAYRRERSSRGRMLVLWGTRCLVLSVIVWMLFGWLRRSFKTELPDLVLGFDATTSMSTVDDYHDPAARRVAELLREPNREMNRLELGRRFWLRDGSSSLQRLQDRYRLRAQLWGGTLQEMAGDFEAMRSQLSDVVPNADQSRLGTCLLSAIEQQRGRSTAAIVLMTDGVTTDGRSLIDAAHVARQRRIPLYLVGMGENRHPADVGIGDVVCDNFAFIGDLLSFDAVVQHHGFPGKQIPVRLIDVASNKVLAEESVTLGANGESLPVRLLHRPAEAGEFDFRIEIGVPENDQIRENNQTTRHVSVRETTIRVLLVQNYPSPEFHFLKRLLGSTLQRPAGSNEPAGNSRRAFELHTLLQDADPEFVEQDETALRVFPTKKEDLFGYDVIVFGDADPTLVGRNALQHIRDFVLEHGGGLVITAGPRFIPAALKNTPLEELLPVSIDAVRSPPIDSQIVTGFQTRLSATGLTMPHLQLADKSADNLARWQQLPELFWLSESEQIRPGGRVLLEHASKTNGSGEPLAVVSLLFAGAGKVIYHSTDESYRWSRAFAGESAFNAYWLQTLRYLCRSRLFSGNQRAELVTDREEYRLQDHVHLRVRFLDEKLAPAGDQPVTVIVEGGGGEARQLSIPRHPLDRTVFQHELSDLPMGDYRAWLASPTVEGGLPVARFSVRSSNPETQNLRMNADELREAAKITGGKFYTLADMYQLPRDLPLGSHIRLEPLPPEPLWNSPWIAGLFVGLLVFEWIMRRRWGLV